MSVTVRPALEDVEPQSWPTLLTSIPASAAHEAVAHHLGSSGETYDVVAGGHGLRLIEQKVADGKIESFQVQEALR